MPGRHKCSRENFWGFTGRLPLWWPTDNVKTLITQIRDQECKATSYSDYVTSSEEWTRQLTGSFGRCEQRVPALHQRYQSFIAKLGSTRYKPLYHVIAMPAWPSQCYTHHLDNSSNNGEYIYIYIYIPISATLANPGWAHIYKKE